MPFSRYDERAVRFNDEELYKKTFKKRGLKHISHYTTPNFPTMTAEQVGNLSLIEHTWRLGDKFYKLAYKHYGQSNMWWVIAWFNKTPTESHVKNGDIIHIPAPLDRVLFYLGL